MFMVLKNSTGNVDTLLELVQLPLADLVVARCICDGGNRAPPLKKGEHSFAKQTDRKDGRIGINEVGTINHPGRRQR